MSILVEYYSNKMTTQNESSSSLEQRIEELERQMKGEPTSFIESKLGCLYLKRAGEIRNIRHQEDFVRGIALIKSCLENIGDGFPSQSKKLIYSHVGNALNLAYITRIQATNKQQIRKEEMIKEDLELFFMGIICSEISKNIGENNEWTYQIIGREYYDLQEFVEKLDVDKLQEIMEKVISTSCFRRYEGNLIQINNILKDKNNVRRVAKARSEILKYTLKNFDESNRLGDNSEGNESYRGMCLVDRVRINRQLEELNEKEKEEMLRKAQGLLDSALNRRLKKKEASGRIGRKNKNREEVYKDYRRLAECEFRLADVSKNEEEKKELYEKSISHGRSAISEMEEMEIPVNSETLGFIASGYFRLDELGKAIEFFNKSKETGDDSMELLSKLGNCYRKLLSIEFSTEDVNEKKIKRIIRLIRNTLGEALQKNDERNGNYFYPYFQLYFTAKSIVKSGRDVEQYGLKRPEDYARGGIEKYNVKNPSWKVKKVGERNKNFVCSPLDNYNLLEPVFVLKRGKPGELEKEREVTCQLEEKIREKLGDERRFILPSALKIVHHRDAKEEGEVLEDVLEDQSIPQKKKIDILKDVLSYLAFIHVNLPLPVKGEFVYENYVRDRLLESGINGRIIEKFVQHYTPIKHDLQQGRFVFYKDAHARNWLVRQDKSSGYAQSIIALDLEEKASCPIELDLVCLLECIDLKYVEKFDLITSYNRSYKKYAENQMSREGARVSRYLNMTIPRAIQLLSWRDISIERKIKVIEDTLKNIKKLKELSGRNYQIFKEDYRYISEGFRDIQNFLQQQKAKPSTEDYCSS